MDQKIESTTVDTVKKNLNRAAVAVGAVLITAPVFAAGEFDVSVATGALSGVMVAVGALGVVKIAPAAAAWAWSLLTRTASR